MICSQALLLSVLSAITEGASLTNIITTNITTTNISSKNITTVVEAAPLTGFSSININSTDTMVPHDTTAAYCALNPNHTMCLHPGASPECRAKTIGSGMSQDGKEAILARHNDLRRRLAKGEEANQPAASDMRELVWDEELERIAQRWVDQCTPGHDSIRTKLDSSNVGQNAFQATTSQQLDKPALNDGLPAIAQSWYDEVTQKGFSSSNINPFVYNSNTGHYTQVVWAETHQVGCASIYYKEGQSYQSLVVCNYSVAGNGGGGSMYTQGTACSACPAGTICNNSLCKTA